jgi:hypothetical protein
MNEDDMVPEDEIETKVETEAEDVAPERETKRLKVINLLSRPEGATVEQMMAETGWKGHTVRGFMSGALKKSGIQVVAQRPLGCRTCVYRIES